MRKQNKIVAIEILLRECFHTKLPTLLDDLINPFVAKFFPDVPVMLFKTA